MPHLDIGNILSDLNLTFIEITYIMMASLLCKFERKILQQINVDTFFFETLSKIWQRPFPPLVPCLRFSETHLSYR